MTGRHGLVTGLAAFVVAATVNVAFHRWLVTRFPTSKSRSRAVAAVQVTIVVTGILARLLVNLGAPDTLSWAEGLSQLWSLGLVMAAPVVALTELLRWLRARRAVPRPALALRTDAPEDPSRRDVLTVVGSGAIVASFSTLAWGVARTRFDLEVVELPVRIARLPRALDGFTIVQISDVHVGVYLGERDLRRAEELVRGLRPDLFVLTGDLVHLRASYLPLACDWVARLSAMARHGGAAILGNHEYYVGRDAVREGYRRAKVDLLINESRVIAPKDGGGLSLLAVDDLYGARHGFGPDLDRAIVTLSDAGEDDRPRILMCHQPQFHPEAEKRRIDLQLSGHTHGGQIAPIGPLVAGAIFGPYVGRHAFGATTLYVNRGFGTSGPPSRVAVRPEITKIVLVAA